MEWIHSKTISNRPFSSDESRTDRGEEKEREREYKKNEGEKGREKMVSISYNLTRFGANRRGMKEEEVCRGERRERERGERERERGERER